MSASTAERVVRSFSPKMYLGEFQRLYLVMKRRDEAGKRRWRLVDAPEGFAGVFANECPKPG